jgi:L-iditol 2-dehydrogenase
MEKVGILNVVDLPDPKPKDKELLIRVHSCGICGSDVLIYRGNWIIPFPRVIGHEFSGEVVSVGNGVQGFEPGDRVSVDPNEACGECEYCRADRPHYCLNMIVHGILVDGGFAELTVAGEKAVYKLPENVSLEEGGFMELLSCTVHAINKAALRVGESVAVFGGGPAGQILHQLANLAGAGRVVMFTHSPEKLDLARKLGVTNAFNPDDVNLPDFEFDVVIDAAGTPKVIEDALIVLGNCGRLIIFGQAPEGECASIDLFNLLMKEISIITSNINPFTSSQALTLLAQKKVDVKSLVSHRVGLDEIQRGFDLLLKRVPGTIKVLVKP